MQKTSSYLHRGEVDHRAYAGWLEEQLHDAAWPEVLRKAALQEPRAEPTPVRRR